MRNKFALLKHSPRAVVACLLASTAFVSYWAFSADPPPAIPAVGLSADPLYAVATDKPAMALALSVEFPTVGAQYRGNADYSNTTEYIGYYDAESCYSYIDAPGETPGTGQTKADFKRFQRVGAASTRMCGTAGAPDGFSGNFLNWSTSSSIDMLRLALTGGDRYIDTPTLTLLQRAYLPNGDYENGCFFNNSNYFPYKQLKKSAGTGIPNYFGAVPAQMQSTAGTNDIYIASRLNQVYFGAGTSQPSGNCGSQSGYTLGVTTSWVGAITSQGTGNSQPSGWTTTSSASRGGSFVLPSGVQEVLYGYNGNWKSAAAAGTITCKESTFTGGSSNSSAKCYVRADTTGQTPVTGGTYSSDPFFYARVKVCDSDTSGVLQDVRNWGTRNNVAYGLCTRYSDGATIPKVNYKPTGVIQAYSEQLRLAAFGYLLQQNNASYSGTWGAGGSGTVNGSARYGGVLRAPMKYVGIKTFNETGVENTVSGGNANKEWNSITGVFYDNPDNNTSINDLNGNKISGVINYLNRFGRTGSLGRYKGYDPVGELYGEALRYLQGLGPTPEAISSISGYEDGYPVYTTWADPYGGSRSSTSDYSCNRSNVLVVGDVNTHDSNRLFMRSADLAQNLPDFAAWSITMKNFEAKTSSTYDDGDGNSQNTNKNPNTANSNLQNGSNGKVGPLMAQAYWAHTHDIRGTNWTAGSGPSLQRPGLRLKSFFFDVNENSASYDANTDVTGANKAGYRRTQNQYFMASKYGGFETDPSSASKNVVTGKSTTATYNTKGNPFYQNDMTTADQYVWQDTDARPLRQGEANTYFLQSDARGVLTSFEDIFSRVGKGSGNIAGGAIQSKNLTQEGDTIYQGRFNPSDWSGDLWAIPVSVNASNVVSLATIGEDGSGTSWTASGRMAALSSPATQRNIFVGNRGATANPVGVPFLWGNIEAGLKTSLDKVSPSSSADGFAEDRLNFIRGDRSKENNPFRSRNTILGDIVNSGVIYSGAPSTSISDAGYGSFYTSNKNRTQAIFVGANDGMMHAFVGKPGSSDTSKVAGDELFAYIPSWLGSKLPALTDPSYVNNHQSYVDGTAVVGEASIPGLATEDGKSSWRSVLVSGSGGGGKGVFALDVTSPATFTASNVMWEFTSTDDSDLGNVVGKPQILKMRTSVASATTATYKWFAVFGSGVNNYVDDGSGVFSATGQPAVFILDLDKAKGTAWTPNVNYFKISLPVDGTLSSTKATGLVNFRAAKEINGSVSQIYMGDLHGNLWKLDFSLLGASNWNINDLSYFNKGTATSPIPMYIAKDTAGNVQPISASPTLTFGAEFGTTYVSFGTGKYLEFGDKSSTTAQSFYTIYDNARQTLDSTPASAAASAISSRTQLLAGTIDTTTNTITTSAFTWGRRPVTASTGTIRSGWYVDFPSGSGHSGERVVSNATVFGNKLIFGTLIPSSTGSTSTCSGTVGSGYQYSVDYTNGNGSLVASSVGIMGEPLVSEVAPATTYSKSDSTGRRTKTITSQVFQQGANGVSAITGAAGQQTRTVIAGRLSWRQINNYQDLKSAP